MNQNRLTLKNKETNKEKCKNHPKIKRNTKNKESEVNKANKVNNLKEVIDLITNLMPIIAVKNPIPDPINELEKTNKNNMSQDTIQEENLLMI